MEAWVSGWVAMPHGRGRDLGQIQGLRSGVRSWCSRLTLLRYLPKVNKIRTLYLELLLPLGKFERAVMGGNGKHGRASGVAKALRGFLITATGLPKRGFQDAIGGFVK